MIRMKEEKSEKKSEQQSQELDLEEKDVQKEISNSGQRREVQKQGYVCFCFKFFIFALCNSIAYVIFVVVVEIKGKNQFGIGTSLEERETIGSRW